MIVLPVMQKAKPEVERLAAQLRQEQEVVFKFHALLE